MQTAHRPDLIEVEVQNIEAKETFKAERYNAKEMIFIVLQCYRISIWAFA